jgi:hypothetical protein
LLEIAFNRFHYFRFFFVSSVFKFCCEEILWHGAKDRIWIMIKDWTWICIAWMEGIAAWGSQGHGLEKNWICQFRKQR